MAMFICVILNAVIIPSLFYILAFQEYWALMESRIPLKPVLRGVIIVALFISSREHTQ